MKRTVRIVLGIGLAAVGACAWAYTPGGHHKNLGGGHSMWCARNASCCQCAVFDENGDRMSGMEAVAQHRTAANPPSGCTYGGGDGAACP